MKSIRTTLIATALMTALSGLALAQNATPSMGKAHAGHMEKMREHKAERHTQHLSELQSKLNLQPSQEAAWNTFTQAMQPHGQMVRPDRAAMEKMTTPERLDRMQAMKVERDAHMQKRLEATKAFYGSLTTEQKQVFDKESRHAMHGGGMHTMKHQGSHGRH
jgi:Spy/CpxP family protein refolding chaperone